MGSRSLKSDSNEVPPSSVIIESPLASYLFRYFPSCVFFWGGKGRLVYLLFIVVVLHLPFRKEKNNFKTIPQLIPRIRSNSVYLDISSTVFIHHCSTNIH